MSMRGIEGDYVWADRIGAAWEAVRSCPEIMAGRRVAITAFDSGTPTLTDAEAARGWTQQANAIVTTPGPSYDDIVGALSDEGGEVWVFDADAELPDFAGWVHLGGECSVITFAAPEVAHPDPPPTWDDALVDEARQWLTRKQEHIREGLSDFRPLTFLRDDLIITRDPVVIGAIDKLRRLRASVYRCPMRT
jgi:hypothetical protein